MNALRHTHHDWRSHSPAELHGTGLMTPLPPRRPRRRPIEPRLDWDSWQSRGLHPEVYAPLRQIAVFILWLFGVLAMIALFSEFWK